MNRPPISEDTRRKISEAVMNRPPISEDTRRKISEAGKGRKMSEDNRHKLYEASKGKTLSKETRRKISKANKGRILSEETRRKMSQKILSEETRRKMSAAQQNIPYDEWESYAKCQLYCPMFNEACRESNRAKYNHKCFLCDKPQAENVTKTGKVKKLSVHHVDMQKSQGCDSNWKLVPLCMKCHGTSHTKQMAARIEYVLAHTSI